MPTSSALARFEATLLRPAHTGDAPGWAFVVLPKAVSATLPRRGRTTVTGTLNHHPFQATLEPDGQLSHWLKIAPALLRAADLRPGQTVVLELAPVEEEPEPELPPDLRAALASSPAARQNWDATTALARLDWIHWITTAKQAKTRTKRIADTCAMLAEGKLRVCCFDPSGFYSKAFRAPEAVA
jgi:hypothetical protein